MLQRLDVKLVLAAISGALVGIHTDSEIDINFEMLWGLPSFLYVYGVSGALFAIPILGPYLRRDDHFLPRSLALVAACVVSFWTAVHAYNSMPWISGLPVWIADEFIKSSIVGAGIVFVAAKFIVSFPWSTRYLLLGLLAAVVGGWAFGALENAPGPDLIFSFIAWHCIVCAALHFGTQRVGETVHA